MSDYTLTLPDEIYQQVRQIAEEKSQPIDEVILNHLRTLSHQLPTLPPDEEAELAALRLLSDDALWAIAKEQLANNLQEKMQVLMDKNSDGSITQVEYSELDQLVERGQQLIVRKSEAAAILTERGYTVSSKNLSNRD